MGYLHDIFRWLALMLLTGGAQGACFLWGHWGCMQLAHLHIELGLNPPYTLCSSGMAHEGTVDSVELHSLIAEWQNVQKGTHQSLCPLSGAERGAPAVSQCAPHVLHDILSKGSTPRVGTSTSQPHSVPARTLSHKSRGDPGQQLGARASPRDAVSAVLWASISKDKLGLHQPAHSRAHTHIHIHIHTHAHTHAHLQKHIHISHSTVRAWPSSC